MSSSITTIAVLGLGTMGQGIAAAAAAAGHPVRAFERPDRQKSATAALRRRLAGFEAEPDLHLATSAAQAVRGADLVIEAVPEDAAVKKEVYAALSDHVGTEAILATNTSSLSLADLSSAVPDPVRFLATHFFNPAELVPGVEVAAGPETDPGVVEAVEGFLRGIGKEPVVVGAGSGFVANRLQLALFLEALACVEDGTATPDDIDRIVRRTFGFRLPAYGPFTVADMAGLDVYASILDSLHTAYGSRFATPPALRDLVDRGRLGLKAGAGFRDYDPAESAELVAGRDARYRRLLAAVE